MSLLKKHIPFGLARSGYDTFPGLIHCGLIRFSVCSRMLTFLSSGFVVKIKYRNINAQRNTKSGIPIVDKCIFRRSHLPKQGSYLVSDVDRNWNSRNAERIENARGDNVFQFNLGSFGHCRFRDGNCIAPNFDRYSAPRPGTQIT